VDRALASQIQHPFGLPHHHPLVHRARERGGGTCEGCKGLEKQLASAQEALVGCSDYIQELENANKTLAQAREVDAAKEAADAGARPPSRSLLHKSHKAASGARRQWRPSAVPSSLQPAASEL